MGKGNDSEARLQIIICCPFVICVGMIEDQGCGSLKLGLKGY